MHTDPFAIPTASWQRRLDAPLVQPGRPSSLTLRALPLRQMPFILRRIAAGARQRRAAGWDPEDILFTASSRRGPGPHQGVPLGGMGAGAIGRGWRGDFRRWQRRPGIYQHGIVWADQFSLFVQRPGQAGQAQVLYPDRPAEAALAAWRWSMDGRSATYHALFPRAWTVYQQPLPGIRLVCRQLSPIIAHNYRESSFPVGHFLWQIENTGAEEARVSLMATWQNGMGTANDLAGGHSNSAFRLPLDEAGHAQVAGVELRHIQRQGRSYPNGRQPAQQEIFDLPMAFAVAALSEEGVEVTSRTRFDPLGDGADLWHDFAADGRLKGQDDTRPAAAGEAIAAAVAATVTIRPGETRQIAFALSWDAPLLRTGFGTAWRPRYTRFYGIDGNAAPAMAADALLHAAQWEAQIAAWQQPILDDPALPDWYKMALFNELYYLVDGGTWWVDGADGFPSRDASANLTPGIPEPVTLRPGEGSRPEDIGHFAYLEGHEYRMLNTYDVHFYASFALAMLWPRLELALQRDIAAATLAENTDPIQSAWGGRQAPRKLAGAVPHDVGWPDEDPWRLVNGYFLHDTNQWKDLNPKFVLQIFRDYVATGDAQFVADVWPAVEAAMAYAARFDRDRELDRERRRAGPDLRHLAGERPQRLHRRTGPGQPRSRRSPGRSAGQGGTGRAVPGDPGPRPASLSAEAVERPLFQLRLQPQPAQRQRHGRPTGRALVRPRQRPAERGGARPGAPCAGRDLPAERAGLSRRDAGRGQRHAAQRQGGYDLNAIAGGVDRRHLCAGRPDAARRYGG